ncbi:hypothetical protein GWK18_12855 [Kocuria sp. JC486]|uniref:hypothetical protein n=1 Tax=Kocuria sp. JC486 TaxID=1970736 RepID=UPI00142020B6|nr:hypothetical protein [Kocuria sp. JC486]NHU86438.1 hypothetical protein [Kocuria sp. JC486]
MRLLLLVLSILLVALTFTTFVVEGRTWEISMRAAQAVVLIAQATAGYFAVKSTSKAGAEARLEINDVLAPLTATLKDIPLAPTAKCTRAGRW